MPKIVEGTFVVKAKLSHNKTVVYCAGIASNRHVIWTEDLSKAIRLTNVPKSDIDNYVSDIYHYNDRYNTPASQDYAVSITTENIAKKPHNFMALFGSINKKSVTIAIAETTQKVAMAISKHARINYPKERFFLYKSKTKFPDNYCQFKYSLIDKTTGLYSKDYYFIMEVPK